LTADQGGNTNGLGDPRRADEGIIPTTLEVPSVAGLQKLRFDAGVKEGSTSGEKDWMGLVMGPVVGPVVSPVSNTSLDEKEKVLSVAWE
jgi:hypothetical protein